MTWANKRKSPTPRKLQAKDKPRTSQGGAKAEPRQRQGGPKEAEEADWSKTSGGSAEVALVIYDVFGQSSRELTPRAGPTP
eukprot:11617103-Heterocapsa_arctica.AAC.1